VKIAFSDGTDVTLDAGEPDNEGLAEFGKRKKALLDMLRSEHERRPNSKRRGSKSEPFDPDKARRRLTGLARSCFGRDVAKQAATPAADRIERLRDVAKTLGRARRLIHRTMQTDVGDDLFSAWWEVIGSEHSKPDGSFDPRDMKCKFKRAVESLGVLETAATHGANHVRHARRGKPPVLSRDDIWSLAAMYRENTGSMPVASDGPFARFVMQFLIATGRAEEVEYESLVEAIKAARRRALSQPAARKWGPSPFDEEA
jgi:hypothetical protein